MRPRLFLRAMGSPAYNASIGPIGELGVAYQLAKRGWSVYTPTAADVLQHFDLIACKRNYIHRIQVKSTSKVETGTSRYSVTAAMGSQSKTRYSKQHCDFIAVLIIPVEWFFIIPIEHIKAISLRFPVNFSGDHRYAQYRDAWHLLETKNPHQQSLAGG